MVITRATVNRERVSKVLFFVVFGEILNQNHGRIDNFLSNPLPSRRYRATMRSTAN
jgi:hypothetical protein